MILGYNLTMMDGSQHEGVTDILLSTTMPSLNDSINGTLDQCDNSAQIERYLIILPILLVSCLVAMFVNVFVIASAYWIRCPITPNLKISLSLAAADATSSSMYGLMVLISDYQFSLGAFLNVAELLRLSGIVITVWHLVALSVNHYIGILKPLHYNSIVTSKRVALLIWILWLCPFVIVISICAAFDTKNTIRDNFLNNTDYIPEFMDTFVFRLIYSCLFFIPILVMVACYSHILHVVRKQQNRWNNLSRVGSTRTKGKPAQKVSRERKQLEGNVRAIYTTLLILGSCIIGWTPALLIYIITCKIGCYISGEMLDELNCNHVYFVMVLRLMDNFLIILKMLLNPIIYSIRMKEIKDGTRRMFLAIMGVFCESRRNALEMSGFYYRSRLQNSTGGGTIQMDTSSVRNNRNGNHVSLNKEENTFL